MEKSFIYSESELPQVVEEIVEMMGSVPIITLEGSLGAGKTTFSKALLKKLGVVEDVLSPTFTYVNKYIGRGDLKIYHFDLYRLQSEEDFVDLGFDEYLYQQNSLVLVEWPEILYPLIKDNYLKLKFDYEGIDKRCLTLVKG